MTTDPNWLKSLTESYRQEVSQSARNLQEEADQIMNLVETIQTALNVDLTEEQVDALIEAFRSTVDPETGAHTKGLARRVLGFFGGKSMSSKNKKGQAKIHGEIDAHNDDIDRQNTEIGAKNREEESDHERNNAAEVEKYRKNAPHDTRIPGTYWEDRSPQSFYNPHRHTGVEHWDNDNSKEREDYDQAGDELEKRLKGSKARLTPRIPEESKREKRYSN